MRISTSLFRCKAECKCRMNPTSLWWNYRCSQRYMISSPTLQTQSNTQQNIRAECKCLMSPTSLWWNYICRQWYVISSTASSDAEQYPTELKVPSSWVKIQDELHKPLQPQSVTPDGTTHAIRDTSQASTDAEQHPTELLQMLWDSRTEIKDISGSSRLLQLAT